MVDTESAPFDFSLANTGDGSFTITSVTKAGANPGQFRIKNASTCAAAVVIDSGNPSCTVRVTFGPGSTGAKTATVEVVTDLSPTPLTVTVSGNGANAPAARIGVSGTVMPFGEVRIDEGPSIPRTVTITSAGNLPLEVGPITPGGADVSQFPNDATACASRTLQPSEACQFTVSFDPVTAGQKTAQISIESNAAASPSLIALAGVAKDPPLPPGTATIRLSSKLPRVKGNTARLPITCVATSTTGCAGKVTLSAKGSALGRKGSNAKKNFSLGSTNFLVKTTKGQTSVRLKGFAVRALKRRGRLAVQVKSITEQPNGGVKARSVKRILKPAAGR